MIVLLACIVGFCLGKFIVQVFVFVALLLVSTAKMLFKTVLLTISNIAFRIIRFIYSKVYEYYQKNKIRANEVRSFSPQ